MYGQFVAGCGELGIRCFVAVDVADPGILDALRGFQAGLIGSGGELKLVKLENVHLTLKFLGDIEKRLLEEVKHIVTSLRFEPFRMTLTEIGAFPNLRRPRVIWMGVSEGIDELAAIFRELEAGFVGLGFKHEGRRFSPHITIARVRSGRNRDLLMEEVLKYRDAVFGGFDVRSIKLKQSVLTPRGPLYSTLAESDRS
ncbi:MAG: RNA 2',3'-cyclic phosphodiesterase [Candidatus Bathyarchaeota archaeon]|nr:RNA 2',3'-cyclic phosphodiesterase [Candidatus Bathyarchaeota archaeon]